MYDDRTNYNTQLWTQNCDFPILKIPTLTGNWTHDALVLKRTRYVRTNAVEPNYVDGTG
jgi:hypothetical protein